jgi:hypothetical protein
LPVLAPDNGVGDALPELERLVGKLLLHGRYNLGDGEEGVEVDDQVLLLYVVSTSPRK